MRPSSGDAAPAARGRARASGLRVVVAALRGQHRHRHLQVRRRRLVALERHARRGVPLDGRHGQPDLPAHRHAQERAPARPRPSVRLRAGDLLLGLHGGAVHLLRRWRLQRARRASRRSSTATIPTQELSRPALGVRRARRVDPARDLLVLRGHEGVPPHPRRARRAAHLEGDARSDGADGALRGSGGAVRPRRGVRRHPAGARDRQRGVGRRGLDRRRAGARRGRLRAGARHQEPAHRRRA